MSKWKSFKLGVIRILFKWFFKKEYNLKGVKSLFLEFIEKEEKETKLTTIEELFLGLFEEEDREFNFRFLEYKLGIITEQQYVNWMEDLALREAPEDMKEDLALQ